MVAGWRREGGDNVARLWDMRDPYAELPPIILRGHEGDLYGGFPSPSSTLAFSPDGQWLATVGHDKIARLWDMQNPSAEPLIFFGHQGWLSTLSFSPDGRWLATASEDSTARLWDMHAESASAQPIVLRGHEDFIGNVAFSPDGRWLATGG